MLLSEKQPISNNLKADWCSPPSLAIFLIKSSTEFESLLLDIVLL